MKKIFLSHSSKDAEWVMKVCEVLENEGYPCWIAPRDIQYGEKWAEGIANGLLDNTQLFVFFLSENSNQSKQVLKEINIAVEYGIPIVIINRIDENNWNRSLKYYLGDLHWYRCAGDSDEQELSRIKELIISKFSMTDKAPEKFKTQNLLNIDEELEQTFKRSFSAEKDETEEQPSQEKQIKNKLLTLLGKNLYIRMKTDDDFDPFSEDSADETEDSEHAQFTTDHDMELQDPFHDHDEKYFSLTDRAKDTLIYAVKTQIDETTYEKYFKAELLDYIDDEDDESVRTYFLDPLASDGQAVAMITFLDEKELVSVNMGLIYHDELRMSLQPQLMPVKKNSGSTEKKKYLARSDSSFIILDMDTHLPVERITEYNNELEKYETYINLRPDCSYFSFNITSGEDTSSIASPFEIGFGYYIGTHGLKQNWLLAAQWFMQCDVPEAYYYLGYIFSKDDLLHDDDLASEYLQKAMDAGITAAEALLRGNEE